MIRFLSASRAARLFSRAVLLLALLLGTAPPTSSQASAATTATSYHVGNSLTADLTPQSFTAFAAQRGLTHTVGYHVRSASSLNLTLSSPNFVTLPPPDPFGTFANALPNYKWNAVTVQPHPGADSTIATDVNAILSLINLTRSNPANANARFYIYSTWPIYGNFQAKWAEPVVDDDSTPTTLAREYFEHVLHRVRAQTDATVLMTPVGDVLNELDKRLSAGLVPGYSNVLSFYRDGLHMNGALGQYTAAATAFATIRGENPIGFVKPEGVFTFESVPPNSDAIYAAINDAIRDVVGTHPYSGITFPDPPRADFDQSGLVDLADLEFLQQSLGKSAVADANGDGDVNDDDLALWQSQLGWDSRRTENFDASDVNRDGVTDTADLAVWRQSTNVNAGYDLDGDADTDGHDFLSWQQSLTHLYESDFNHDYVVDADDYDIWEANDGFTLHADANDDGAVDQLDYAVWQAEEGRVWPNPFPYPDVLAVPEPASFVLLPAALLASHRAARNRRR